MRSFTCFELSDFLDYIDQVEVERSVNHIQIHHTWKPRKSDYAGERTIRGMWNYHVNTRGWHDIGQHFSIAPDGTIWDGRDLERDPAGISGKNDGGVMIEIIGNFDIGEENLKGEQLDSVLGAVNALLRRFSLSEREIVFHREYSAKTCPGSSIMKSRFMDQVKNWSGKKMSKVFSDVPADYIGLAGVEAMKNHGLMVGKTDGTFGFGETLKKEELALILHRFADYFDLYER